MTQLDLFTPSIAPSFPTPPHLLAIIRNADGRYRPAEIAAACQADARLTFPARQQEAA